MENSQNGRTAKISREKEPYIAPKMEAAILRDDIVLISALEETVNLDESAQYFSW